MYATVASHVRVERAKRVHVDRRLLLAGVVAGPFYLVFGLVQALTRPGFDLHKHELSQLALGELGWMQQLNFLISAALVIAAAVGLRAALRGGKGQFAVPVLSGIFALGMIGATIFTADPSLGFPTGTPADAAGVSTHGLLHLLSAAIGFFCLIAASIIFGRRMRRDGRPTLGNFSIAAGIVFLVTFVAGGMLGGAPGMTGLATLSIWIGVVAGWSWLTAACWYLLR
jgi:hypothetical membrane protein